MASLDSKVFSKLLSQSSSPRDVLQTSAYYIDFLTGASGVFISTHTLEYMDMVIGSMVEKRSAKKDGGISVSNVYKTFGNSFNQSGGYITDAIYVLKTSNNWYVGIDKSDFPISHIKKTVEDVILMASPVYLQLIKLKENDVNRDALTFFYNKKKFYDDMKIIYKTFEIKNLDVYIFSFALHNIEYVNNLFSYNIGDEIIKNITAQIKNIFIGYGSVYRLSGNLFMGISFGLNSQQADDLVKCIEDVTFQSPGGVPIYVSAVYKKINRDNLSAAKVADIKSSISRVIHNSEMLLMEEKNKRKEGGQYANTIKNT